RWICSVVPEHVQWQVADAFDREFETFVHDRETLAASAGPSSHEVARAPSGIPARQASLPEPASRGGYARTTCSAEAEDRHRIPGRTTGRPAAHAERDARADQGRRAGCRRSHELRHADIQARRPAGRL